MPRSNSRIPALAIVAWTLLLGILFVIQAHTHKRHNHDMMLEAARAYFDLIVVTRQWNARHGGVYVFLDEDTAPNPYLPEEGRSLEAVGGQTLARVNPAFMTRQISELSVREDHPRLHITSLSPLRPENAPTAWERLALERFEAGTHEVAQLDSAASPPQFLYMAPLFVTEPCLPCHAKQGYKLGDVRGGISVLLPAGRYLAAQNTGLAEAAMLFLVIWAVGSLGIGFGASAILRGRQRAEEASKAKSVFLSILSHELRTPLNGLLGMLDLTLCTGLTPEQRSFLEDARKSGLVLNEQVKELLELSGLTSGLAGREVTLFSPATLLADVLEVAGTEARRKGLCLTFQARPDLPCQLRGDGARFARVIEILVGNAIKFTPSGQVSVTLSATSPDKGRLHLVATIVDSGPGIDPKRLPGLFEPFAAKENVLVRSTGGLGVGLAIARAHAAILDGNLGATSLPGHGASFTLSAPFDLPDAPSPVA
ncbi:MAG: ATP-binding protein [Solidesulfovibrio sp. DCME]|uniref:ATP-binding protein n=1 Tax=Solidesulfovibrio sp. DCME TaxID=3447380 RepID=UPI003D0E81EB